MPLLYGEETSPNGYPVTASEPIWQQPKALLQSETHGNACFFKGGGAQAHSKLTPPGPGLCGGRVRIT